MKRNKNIELEIYNILNEIKFNTKSILQDKKNFLIKESSNLNFQEVTGDMEYVLRDLGVSDVRPITKDEKNFNNEKNKKNLGPNGDIFEVIKGCIDGSDLPAPGSIIYEAMVEDDDGKNVPAVFTPITLNQFIERERKKETFVRDPKTERGTSKVLACEYYSQIETFKKASEYLKAKKPIPSLANFYDGENAKCLAYSLAQINSTPIGCNTIFYMNNSLFAASQNKSLKSGGMVLIGLGYGSWFLNENGYSKYINWKKKLDLYVNNELSSTSTSGYRKPQNIEDYYKNQEEFDRVSELEKQNLERGLGKYVLKKTEDTDGDRFVGEFIQNPDDQNKKIFFSEFIKNNPIPDLLTPWDVLSNRHYQGVVAKDYKEVNLIDFSTVEQVGNLQKKVDNKDLKTQTSSAVNFDKLQPFTDEEMNNILKPNVNEKGNVIMTVDGKRTVDTDPYCLKKGQIYVNLRTTPEVDYDLYLGDTGNFVKWTAQQYIGHWDGTYILTYLPIYEVMCYPKSAVSNGGCYGERILKNESQKKFFEGIDSMNLGAPTLEASKGYYGNCLGDNFSLFCSVIWKTRADVALAQFVTSQHRNQGYKSKWGFENGKKLNNQNIFELALRTGVAKYWMELDVNLSGEVGKDLGAAVIDFCGEDYKNKNCKLFVSSQYVEPCRTGNKEDISNYGKFNGIKELETAQNYKLDNDNNLVIYREKFINDEIKNWKLWCENNKKNKYRDVIYDCSKVESGDMNKLNDEWSALCSSNSLDRNVFSELSDTMENFLTKYKGKKVKCMDNISDHTTNSNEIFKSTPTLMFNIP